FISCVAFAQSGELNLPPDKKYEEAVLGFKNEERIQVNSIELFADSLIYQSNGSFKSHEYDKIRYIQVKDTTFAGSGAIVGAGIMLFSSLVTAIDISNSPSRQFKSDPGLRIIGLTVGGAGVGALIGMIFKRPRKYYVHYE
ncbi:MAG: hypothetical protein LC664_15605, partial [Flavobacteriales bacterium]|nr:hypothetical protein [Flavobacteriales bacterium]